MELQLQHLCKHYGTKCAVNHVSTTLTPGVYGLLGANGAGKTTLMRMIHEIAPVADAMTVSPSLEDLFLYHFGEEAGIERSIPVK